MISVILTDMNPDALIRAIEENTAAFLLALGRAGGGEERDDSEITWTIGGSPLSYHNAVVSRQPDARNRRRGDPGQPRAYGGA